MTTDYSPATLAAAAGVDPWALARKVTDGRPDEVRRVGQAFQRARTEAMGVARLGATADRTTAAAYRNDGVQVWDAEATGRRTRGLLSENGDDMEDVGRAVNLVADELTSTSTAVEKELTTLTDQINGVIARRNAFFARVGPLAPLDRTAAEQGFVDEAVGLVRGCGQRVQGDVDGYDRVLASRTGFLADLGYEVPTDDGTGLAVPEILRNPPGAQLEGEAGTGVLIPGPGGGVVAGAPPVPVPGAGPTDHGPAPFPLPSFPVPDGTRVHAANGEESGGTGAAGEVPDAGAPEENPFPDGPPPVHEGQQGKHQEGHNNFDPDRGLLTADPDELIKEAGTGEQVGAVPVGEPGSKERIDFGQEIGVYKDPAGHAAPTTVGIVHYSKKGAHIVPGRPR